MAITLTVSELARALSNYSLTNDEATATGEDRALIVKQAERLHPVASSLVNEYIRGSSVPGDVCNEAVIRTASWLNSDAQKIGIKSQKVDDLQVEYFSQRNALRYSGAESLLSRYKQRRAL